MITPYSFDNANVNGDKEAVIVPNPPTLVNKLSANETNNIKDKINEVVEVVNVLSPTPFGSFRLELKGDGNTLNTIQVGDRGRFYDGNTYEYNGGDINDIANYTEISDRVGKIQIVATAGQTVFGIGTAAKATAVFREGALLDDGDWSQSGTNITTSFPFDAGERFKPI